MRSLLSSTATGRRGWLLPIAAGLVVFAASCGGGSDSAGPPTEAGPAGSTGTSTIGAAGGVVASPDGRVTVDVPSGALVSDVGISVERLSESDWPEDVADADPFSVYRLSPDGTDFAIPVTITQIFNLADLRDVDGMVLVPISGVRPLPVLSMSR